MPLTTIADFVAAKQEWIKNQQHKVELQQRLYASLPPANEGCYFQGQLYKLRILPAQAGAWQVNLLPHTQEIVVQLGGNLCAQQVLQRWYRCRLQAQLEPIMLLWQDRLQLKCAQVQVQVRKMKTRWGSCTPATTRIRINLELVKRAPSCLEYVVVHELLHLLEPAHNRRFYALLDQYLPDWRQRRTQLRSLPIIS
jgi:hypothetical protein